MGCSRRGESGNSLEGVAAPDEMRNGNHRNCGAYLSSPSVPSVAVLVVVAVVVSCVVLLFLLHACKTADRSTGRREPGGGTGIGACCSLVVPFFSGATDVK